MGQNRLLKLLFLEYILHKIIKYLKDIHHIVIIESILYNDIVKYLKNIYHIVITESILHNKISEKHISHFKYSSDCNQGDQLTVDESISWGQHASRKLLHTRGSVNLTWCSVVSPGNGNDIYTEI